jgi:hypothetical protein
MHAAGVTHLSGARRKCVLDEANEPPDFVSMPIALPFRHTAVAIP